MKTGATGIKIYHLHIVRGIMHCSFFFPFSVLRMGSCVGYLYRGSSAVSVDTIPLVRLGHRAKLLQLDTKGE